MNYKLWTTCQVETKRNTDVSLCLSKRRIVMCSDALTPTHGLAVTTSHMMMITAACEAHTEVHLTWPHTPLYHGRPQLVFLRRGLSTESYVFFQFCYSGLLVFNTIIITIGLIASHLIPVTFFYYWGAVGWYGTLNTGEQQLGSIYIQNICILYDLRSIWIFIHDRPLWKKQWFCS